MMLQFCRWTRYVTWPMVVGYGCRCRRQFVSIGSAAGVALMGQAKGMYTFFQHLRWSPIIFVGYAASIAVHLWLNKSLM